MSQACLASDGSAATGPCLAVARGRSGTFDHPEAGHLNEVARDGRRGGGGEPTRKLLGRRDGLPQTALLRRGGAQPVKGALFFALPLSVEQLPSPRSLDKHLGDLMVR